MKRIVYVSFELDTESYDEANEKLKNGLAAVDKVLSDTILLDNKQKEIRKVLATCKIVNHSKI